MQALCRWTRSWSKRSLRSKGETPTKTENCKVPKQKAPVATELTPNEKIVQILLDRLNAHESVLPLFDAKADIIFPEATMTIEEYVEEEKSIEKSFPDFRLEITTKVKEQEDGSVVVGVYGHGKHTGEPYGFGPYPAIDAKNVYVRNDPE